MGIAFRFRRRWVWQRYHLRQHRLFRCRSPHLAVHLAEVHYRKAVRLVVLRQAHLRLGQRTRRRRRQLRLLGIHLPLAVNTVQGLCGQLY